MPPQKKQPKKISGKEKLGETSAPATAADLAADYQWSIALLNSDPELRKAFRQAVKQGWSSGRFIAEIQDTKWFKQHSSAWRQNELQRIVDPASWNAARKGNRAAVEDVASQMGAVLSGPQMKRFADDAMAFGWNESQLKNQLSKYIKAQSSGPNQGMYSGAAGEAFTRLRQAANANGYSIPKGKMGHWVAAIARGDETVENIAATMRRAAAAAYPALSNELLAGSDLDDLAAPYRDTMSRLLEIPPDKIDLNDNTLRRALSTKDEKGKYTTMPLYDFEDQIRKDDRWQYTDNAKKEILGEVMRMGRAFGRTG